MKHRTKFNKNMKKIVNHPSAYIVILLIAVAVYLFGAGNYESIFNLSGTLSDGSAEIHFIDVGQGDSALVISSTGSILIDAGPGDSGNKVATYVKNRIDKIDYLILSHPHEDHIGGVPEVMEALNVENIIMPDKIADSSSFDRMLRSIEESNAKVIPAERGQKFKLDDLEIEILSPSGDLDDVDANNASVVTRLIFGETSFLFMGDAEKDVEEDLIKSGLLIDSDVIKIGHHGSSTSSDETFIRKVSPYIAVISSQEGNSYGHPHLETTLLLDKLKITTYRTDTIGTVVLRTDGKTVALK